MRVLRRLRLAFHGLPRVAGTAGPRARRLAPPHPVTAKVQGESVTVAYNTRMPDDLQRQQRDIIAGLDAFLELSTITIAARVIDEVIAATPKVTGLTAANWRVSIGRADEDAEFSPTQARRKQRDNFRRLGAYRVRNGRGPRVFLSNPVPWIDELNRSGGRRSRVGFVQTGIRKGLARADRDLEGNRTVAQFRRRLSRIASSPVRRSRLG